MSMKGGEHDPGIAGQKDGDALDHELRAIRSPIRDVYAPARHTGAGSDERAEEQPEKPR